MSDLIVEGNYVVLEKNYEPGNMKIVPVLRDTLVHYGKLHFYPTALIGSTFGSVFSVQNNQMVEIKNFEQFNEQISTQVKNNLITFNEKSDFSKEKILKRKKKQSHSNILTVVRPTLLLLNELLYAREKLGGLRCDLLSQILTLSNIQNGSKCLLLDNNLGLMTAAVMSRILPDGLCIQMMASIEALYSTRTALEMLNISKEDSANRILAITISDLYKVLKGNDRFESDQETAFKEFDKTENYEITSNLSKKETNRKIRNDERANAATILKTRSLDSLVLITQKDHPLSILKITLEFLAPSRQFVIYSDTIEPLLECHRYLKQNHLAVSLSMSESWLRRYQVLPDRTRPEMNTSGCGGYLLSGTKAHLTLEPSATVVEDGDVDLPA